MLLSFDPVQCRGHRPRSIVDSTRLRGVKNGHAGGGYIHGTTDVKYAQAGGSRESRQALMRGVGLGRRVATAVVLASSTGTGLIETRAFIACPSSSRHARSTPTLRRSFLRRSCLLAGAGHAGFESNDEERKSEETYGNDDQRMFWDTAVKILKGELDSTDDGHHEAADLSRVWDFVAHNRDGKNPRAEASPLYRATGLYFPGLEAKPWWDRSEFPWLRELEEAAPDITREMKSLARAGGERSYRGGTGEMSTVYDATQGWGTMRIRYMGRFGQPGVNYALLPRTLSALRRLPLAPETAAFQRQLPGTGLPLHVDPSNFVLGCHLGVVIPSPAGVTGDRRTGKNRVSGGGGFGFGAGGESASTQIKKGGGTTPKKSGGTSRRRKGDVEARGSGSSTEELASAAVGRGGGGDGQDSPGGEFDGKERGSEGERAWIEVAGEKRHWETGRSFVFDPSFLHRTRNPTEGERVILNVDIWHPGLREVEKTAVRRVCELVEQWNARSGVFEK